ncbi:MAG: serine/threonine protein kinase [Alteromonadaceae bacterium]|nr:serine/threonine protein kinase [Alteromonadaceae bacterium]|tara:strand:- start:1772 stop:2770 length:999 start_codon:yes stop_codon:yes gene_type:complete
MVVETTGHPYEALTPDTILDAVEAAGYAINGRLFPLNSYENRVYQVGIEDSTPVIVKFYRPDRWTPEQILEEHAFVADLEAGEIPVVAALPGADGRTLFEHAGFYFAVFPQRGGQAPDTSEKDTLYRLGQWLGRLHAIGSVKPYGTRPSIRILDDLRESRDFLVQSDFIPGDLLPAYTSLLRDLEPRIEAALDQAGDVETARLHGDCHGGNLLVRDERILMVDFDDSRQGPPIQDLWLLLNGDHRERGHQLAELLEGYEQFNSFNRRERILIEPLRTLRVVRHAAWLGKRWSDPTFPMHFPWFGQPRFWSDHILMLREQLSALDEPPLSLAP